MNKAAQVSILLALPLLMFQNCGQGFKGAGASDSRDVTAFFDQEGELVGPLPPLENPPPPTEPGPVEEGAIPSNCTHGTNDYGPYPSGADPDLNVEFCQVFSELNKIVYVKGGVEYQVAKQECNGPVKHERSCRDKLAVYNPNNPPDISEGRYQIHDRAYRLWVQE